MNNDYIRITADVAGAVQGVGFRPALYRLARAAGLGGSVQNRSGIVRLVLEGPRTAIDAFLDQLPADIPHPARIERVLPVGEPVGIHPDSVSPFQILPSEGDGQPDVVIPADLAICDACDAEIYDPAGRRYGYAFTTCTACGPRYTVVNGMPYDRERTTMRAFPMCPECLTEYEDSADRRFHAETIACPACGPTLSLLDTEGSPLNGDPLRSARAMLADGSLLAIRGIGGFLLAADAFDSGALSLLRERKHRPHKPFAVMARNLDVVRHYCDLPDRAGVLLESPERPIVILDLLPAPRGATLPLALLTPDADTLGVMLPTSPLHELLFRPLADDPTPAFDLLVMTSGNRCGEPICIANEEALTRLSGIADAYLCHDRPINLRNDDSLFAIQQSVPQVWRRARGYAPEPIVLPAPLTRTVLAVGAEIKNTIAIAYGDRAVVSPHIGDLETPEANDGFEQVVRCLPEFLGRRPDAIAVDLHPDMHSTRVGAGLARRLDIPLVQVQHHHAHGAACLAEHGLRKGFALVMDGTGLGTDGTVWGAELLWIDPSGFRRLATFAAAPLPGGDAAVIRPVRQLAGRWNDMLASPNRITALGISPIEWRTWRAQCARGLNAPVSHAAGRVFDAYSAALGLSTAPITYEGQAAIRLETAAHRADPEGAQPEVPFTTREEDGLFLVDWAPAFDRVAAGLPAPEDVPSHALAFHRAVAQACLAMIRYGFVACSGGGDTVALSGGVFMNRVLTALLVAELEELGVTALVHRRTPPNDGCISFGQAVIAGGM